MVIGPIASGKSTLCKAILGEVPFSQGEVNVSPALKSGRVGYCEQTPFLLNTTIRNNILGFAPLNDTLYREVIEAAALKPDLAFLPHGDESSIGSNGLALSGGQKKRLSLARALYLDCAFFLFDDILSGLDADTEDQVFHRVFGPGGLLRRRGATAVMCTNSTHYLPFAHHIIALGEGGVVREQGTFEELSRGGGYIHSLSLNGNPHSNGREGPVPLAESKESDLKEPADLMPHEPRSKVEDDRSRMLQDYTVYRHYLVSLGKRSIAAFTIFGFGWGFFYNWGTVWLKFWSEDLASAQQSHSNSFYVGLYGLFQATCLVSIFLSFFICFRTMIHTSGASLHK
ncbi:ATP-binding cassette domain-containing protein, partial [Candidatus Bathyarchaeota archaeon]|nr:ATP-binding cassette domain-containing protein [Candidatus Bathyarchaeota archaeon]